jgi:hypothetical protein
MRRTAARDARRIFQLVADLDQCNVKGGLNGWWVSLNVRTGSLSGGPLAGQEGVETGHSLRGQSWPENEPAAREGLDWIVTIVTATAD